MTSQHFDDGWDNWGEDWGASENNNNPHQNSHQLSQQNQQYQTQLTSTAPMYSPFSYQQSGHSISQPPAMHAASQSTVQPNPFAKTQNQPQQQQQQNYGIPVNFFNPTQFSEANVLNNNNNLSQYPSNQQPQAYSYVQSPITSSTITSSPSNINANNYNHQDATRQESLGAKSNPVQYQTSLPPSNLPPQSSANFTSDPNLATQTQTPIQTHQMMYSGHNVNHARNVATPPTLQQNYDSNSNFNATPPQSSTYQQYSQWNDQQRSQSNESASNATNWHPQQQPIPYNPYANNHQMPPASSNTLEWQNLQQTPPVNPPVVPPPAVSVNNVNPQTSNSSYYNNQFEHPKEQISMQNQEPQTSTAPMAIPPPPVPMFQPPKFENIENYQTPVSEHQAISQLPPSSSPLTNTTSTPKNPSNELSYPENRERLDDVVPPSSINSNLPISTSAAPSIDRHNYLVTGQLSQDFPVFTQQQQNLLHESFNENLPPPGLSRMVVGEPENNQQQVAVAQNDAFPPRTNRMVTGTEMTPASFMNYQRQADGEVSHEPSNQRLMSTYSINQAQPPVPQIPQRIVEDEEQQQNFNISDRNLYLVAGESDVNNQRVITGVESNAPINIINPLQNLHIEDDEDFVNISVTQRNVDGDGMDEQHMQQNLIQIPLDNSHQREEEIEGANDNNNESNNIAHQPVNQVEIPPIPVIPLNEQIVDFREDIEGANDDSSDQPKPQPADFDEKRKSIDSGMRSQKQNVTMSSEDSELRELERNMKSKTRRNKKYESNDSESASLDEHVGKSRDRYDDRYRKGNRDRVREEYEKYKKKEKERRSGGRSRRNDDTDGSRYAESRRTDDEEEDKRRNKTRRDRRSDERVEGDDKERDRKDRKHRDHREPRRKGYYEDDRRVRRDVRDKYYDEAYSGRRSRNTSDRERDYPEYRPGRSSRGPYDMQGYYQQQAYGYDPNYYYQQQYSEKLSNWLEQIRLTNPQAYEYYKSYYGHMLQKPQIPAQPAMEDIGGSLRSGYNSSSERASTSRFISGGNITNPLRSLNTSFIDNTNEYQSLQYQAIGKDFNQPYSSLNYSNYDIYGDSRQKVSTEVAASRMTPQKFQCLHGFVRLTNGLMITVDTLNTDDKYLVKIENAPIFDKKRRLYQTYPGPLIRGASHKKTVIEFCEEKMKHSAHVEFSLRSSYALLWSYLILMIRQNGSYTEHDIAELLMKNSEEYRSYEMDDTKSSTNNNINNNEVDDENATDVSDSEENVTSEHNSNSVSQSHQTSHSVSKSIATENVVLDKFKSYLLYGNINDALDYATDNNLWGHALFLASKVDRRQHANVMLKFANKLSYNDPLQTLYQIMSGRMPACATNFDDKWGDWRPHLAMIISNCTDKPDLVKRSILALGDTLSSRGDIFGSQFCYLLIDPQFTDYSDTAMSNGKIGLLGTSIQKSFNEFATDDSIIMTEVYEYARSLNTENYFISSLQKYKFLLASNMLDHGFKLKCLLYMEQISRCIIQQPQLFENTFVSKVYALGDRLKYYDPVMEKMYEDNAEAIEDQKWLQDLTLVLQNQSGSSYNEQYIPSDAHTYTSNDVYNPIDYQNQQNQQTTVYDPTSQHNTPIHAPTIPSQTYEEHDSQQFNNYEQQNQVPLSTFDQNAAYNQYQMQDQQTLQNYNYNQNSTMQNENQHHLQNNEQQQNQQQSYFQPTFEANSQANYQPNDGSYNTGYGWDQPKPNITMGATMSNKYDETSTQEKTEPEKNNKEEQKNSASKKPESEKPKKQAQSGWFSSLFRIGKGPNQMILPDDKNPTIVWDEKTKKWVNKDGETAETESFKPPPKMGEMGNSMPQPMQNMQQTQPIQNVPQSQPIPQQNFQQQLVPQMQQQPIMDQQMINQNQMQHNFATMPVQQPQQQMQMNQNISEQETPQPVTSAPNMFKMQRGRNLKKSYVDILGNAGKTVSQPKELAPQMDMHFTPTAQPQGMQFYNPNDFQ